MPTNTTASGAEILKIAQDYKHNPNQHVVLNPYKEAVLLLRAKYATYDSITETLNEQGVKVSEATVRNFCRRHHTAMKQLRNDLERKNREAATTQTASSGSSEASPSAVTTRSSFSETSKPGPKIARDEL